MSSHPRRSRSRTAASLGLLTLLALAQPLLSACVSSAGDLHSTDTGNPPAIDERAVHVKATDAPDEVEVMADAGVVSPAGAAVTVSNNSRGVDASTTVAADGSFTVKLPGSVDDQYTVVVEAEGETSQITLGMPPDGDPALTGLVGQQYLLESATGFELEPDTQLSVGFSETEFNFSAGCNGHFGTYTFCDGKLCLEGLGSTLIGCGAALQAQDEWLADFFTSGPALSLEGDRVTFENPDATLVLLDREVANPDRSLTGRTWTIDTFINGGAASGGPLATSPTVSFDEDGTVHVFSGCNSGDGSFEVSGANIEIADIGFTEAGCSDELQSAREAEVQAVLNAGTLSFEIEAARLTLMRGDIGLSATTE